MTLSEVGCCAKVGIHISSSWYCSSLFFDSPFTLHLHGRWLAAGACRAVMLPLLVIIS